MTTSTLNLSQELLVGEVLKRTSHRFDNRIAFKCDDQSITFGEVDERATKIAAWLQSKNIQKDSKVAFMLRNSIAFSELAFGISLSGGVGVPVNFRLSPAEVAYILANSDSEIVFIDVDYVPLLTKIKDQVSRLRTIVVVHDDERKHPFTSYEEIFKEELSYLPCEQLQDHDAAFIMYTSGTTGKPKGAVLSHRNFYINAMNISHAGNSFIGESIILVPPQFHIAGLLLTIKGVLTAGMNILMEDFNPVAILQAIEKEKINTIFLVPAMWNFLFQVPNIKDYDLSSIVTCATGAAISPVELKKAILNYFPNAMLLDHFGQSETTATTTCLVGEDALRKPSSVGLPLFGVETRIVDEDMNDVPMGEVGEILYRGPTVMLEYYNNPQATAEAFEGGWFHSGDLVKKDEDGYIYVVDRKNVMINSGGENIYPAEIEEILYQIPEILECAVIGLPDSKWGERVVAVVVLKENETLEEDAIINYCAEQVASFKKPKEVIFIEQLPRISTGKVLKDKLRDSLLQNH